MWGTVKQVRIIWNWIISVREEWGLVKPKTKIRFQSQIVFSLSYNIAVNSHIKRTESKSHIVCEYLALAKQFKRHYFSHHDPCWSWAISIHEQRSEWASILRLSDLQQKQKCHSWLHIIHYWLLSRRANFLWWSFHMNWVICFSDPYIILLTNSGSPELYNLTSPPYADYTYYK